MPNGRPWTRLELDMLTDAVLAIAEALDRTPRAVLACAGRMDLDPPGKTADVLEALAA